jgi:hypothetical protein
VWWWLAEVKVAVATADGKLFYKLIKELKRRGINFIVKCPGEPLPFTVKAALTSMSEASKVKSSAGPNLKVITCRVEEVGFAIAEALAAAYGLENEAGKTLIIGVDPGEITGYAAVAGGVVVDKGSCSSLQSLFEAIERSAQEWKPKMLKVKVGGKPSEKSLSKQLKSFLDELSVRLRLDVYLQFVNEAGTTVRARRLGAKHKEADEASAVEIALRSS